MEISVQNQQNMIDILKTIFDWKEIEFLKLAFRYNRLCEKTWFIQWSLRDKYNVNISGEFSNVYFFSKKLSKAIDLQNLENILEFTFYCFGQIADRTLETYPDGGVKRLSSKLLKEIINADGKYHHVMSVLKDLFIAVGWLNSKFEFGNKKYLLKLKMR